MRRIGGRRISRRAATLPGAALRELLHAFPLFGGKKDDGFWNEDVILQGAAHDDVVTGLNVGHAIRFEAVAGHDQARTAREAVIATGISLADILDLRAKPFGVQNGTWIGMKPILAHIAHAYANTSFAP